MEFINIVLGVPFGYVIYLAYNITNSYGLAIIVFAIAVKILLFPVMVLAHKNSIRLLQLQPSLNALKQRYEGDKAGLSEAQYELFKKERYRPMLGILPLFIQLFLVMGMLQVMYRPLQHILRIDAQNIERLVSVLEELSIDGGFAPQLAVVESFSNYPMAFQEVLSEVPNGDVIFQKLDTMEMVFWGFDLGAIPSFMNPNWNLMIILFSGMVAFAFCMVQNAISPGALSQSKRTNMGLTMFTVGLSVYFAWALPVGVGLYWTVGNFTAIVVVLFLNQLLPPKKLAADALAHLHAVKKTKEQLKEETTVKKELEKREKEDVAKFKKAKKQLVFYAISGGQYKYYKTVIEYVLANSDITIHYVTNDPKDKLFSKEIKGLIPYYIGQRKMISVFLKLDCDIMVTTVPEIQSFHMKRSIVRDDVEYIYMFHGLLSVHLVVREIAFDHYDTVFCVGPHQVQELRRREEMASMPRKNLVKTGYGHYDQLVLYYKELLENRKNQKQDKPKILIAPSWQEDNILDSCIENVLASLLGQGYEIYIRPHPQYLKLFPERMSALQSQYAYAKGEVSFDLDFTSDESIFTSDILITDWSGIAYEFAYSTLKPCVFINTPMKVLNPYYEDYKLPVLDIVLRDKVGVSIELDNLEVMRESVASLLVAKDTYKKQIAEIVEEYVYYPGRSGEAGGKYIIRQIKSKT